ncbi:MAG: hypothetical protein HYY29_00395 [Chloroflexi bacterium]|nr:hypothetical protein [Chloroflexota bacterium]
MFRQLLARIARSLRAQSISYMVIGGQALLLYGEPRMTRWLKFDEALARDSSHRFEELRRQLAKKK